MSHCPKLSRRFLEEEAASVDRYFSRIDSDHTHRSRHDLYVRYREAPCTTGQKLHVIVAAQLAPRRSATPFEFLMRVYECDGERRSINYAHCREEALFDLLAAPPRLIFEKTVRRAYVAAGAEVAA